MTNETDPRETEPKARRRPMVESLEGEATLSPQDAPPPPDAVAAPPPRKRRRLFGFRGRLAVWAVGLLVPLVAGLALYDLVESWAERLPWLGWLLGALAVLAAAALLMLALGELTALARLRRLSEIRAVAESARIRRDEAGAEDVEALVERLYAGRADLAWARRNLAERRRDGADPETRLDMLERELVGPLDAAAGEAIAQAAGRVATATALMPSALLDGLAALYLNLVMIRRVAQVYGGRAGAFGSLRLARRVVEHAMAAGLIALGDDFLEPLIGGGITSKLSRRAGEGVVNGFMTARIGLAAMDVCRPMPFHARGRPKLRELAWRAVRASGGAAPPPRTGADPRR